MRDFVVSLSQETLQVSSDLKSIPPSTIVTGLDPPMVHGLPGAQQILPVYHKSPLQAGVMEATDREEDAQGFQMLLVIEQRRSGKSSQSASPKFISTTQGVKGSLHTVWT